ncbi:cell wall hydrolase [Paenibacillaceae bacterium WGS1546]|uniref:cell wall hydrolase n=1 Tax=Cohnella sp. WGS1546 TaxID=3366810 RepID=UPI00372D0263
MLSRSKLVGRIAFAPLTALILLAAALTGTASKAEAAQELDATIKINGAEAKLAEPAMTDGGRLFLPIASLAARLNAQTAWDKNNETVTIHSAHGDKIELGNGVPVVYFNGERYLMDTAPFVTDGRIYIPLRDVAELLHATVKWDADARLAEIEAVDLVTVTEDYGIEDIVQDYGISRVALLARNGYGNGHEVKEGSALKVVVPSLLDSPAKPYTEADYMLLAKLTQVESGYEGYEGQLAVANVVLNRVKDSRFPDSIRDVIYSGKQFPVAHNGMLDKSVPNASVLRAAKDALNGKNNVKDAVYFYNPRVTKGPFWSGLETVATFGNHRFAK